MKHQYRRFLAVLCVFAMLFSLPVLAYADDDSSAAAQKGLEAIKATGDDSRLIYTRMPGIDHGRPARIFYMGQTYDWLFSHSLLDPGREVNRDFVITAEMLQNAYQDLGRNFEPDYDE